MSDLPGKQKRWPGFTTLIVIGLGLGLFCGLVFGELTHSIKWIGDVYVGLLQMAVLPYVAMSLVASIGRMSPAQGIRLLRIGVLVILGLWLVGLVALAIMTQSFPDWESGSFFSSRFTEQPEPPNWLDLFVPSNPFRSLANNSIPAVVVFSIGIGIALMTIPGKSRFLDPLEVLVDALSRLNKLVVQLTPLGLFAIVANTAGTVDFWQFSLIQGYLYTYAAAAVILSFLVLPALVAALTPLRFTDVVRESRDPLIAAFVIGNSFVVLPMVIDAVGRLQQNFQGTDESGGHEPEYLVPLAYPFPDIGRIVGLIFIPFAAWFYGAALDPEHVPTLLGVGLLGSFGKPVITIPLLLEIAELPGDIFNLFLASGVVAARFGDLMKTMHLMAFSLLAGCLISGVFRIDWRRLLVTSAASLLLLALAAMGIRAYLTANFKDSFSKEQLITERELIFPADRRLSTVHAEILERSLPNPVPLAPGQSRVQRIQETGKIRIGYVPDRLPYSYFSDQGVLIGFDIEMAWYLADDLGVDVQFVPIRSPGPGGDPESQEPEQADIHQQLQDDHFDVAMGAFEGTIRRAALLPSPEPYMMVTMAVVVADHDKRQFQSVESIRAIPDLTMAVVKGSYFAERASRVLPDDVTIIELDSASEFFAGVHERAQGLVTNAESGSAWTLRDPRFTVANPLEGRVQVPLYYLAAPDSEFEGFLQNWLTLKRADGTYRRLYDHWILGLDDEAKTPRWCVIRDVFGWVQ